MIHYLIEGTLLVGLLFLWFIYKRNSKKLGKKNIELQQKANEQFRLQQDFISTLSQELRTPLYGIMGLTNLIEEEYPEIKNGKNLKSLKFSGDYLFTLINNVLHVNFLDSKEMTVQNTLFNLKEVTQNLINSFGYATENSDNILHFEFDSKIDYMVYGDAAIISQILMNLISNSLRYTKNGDVNFLVGLNKKVENTATIHFKINHNGYNISKEDEKSIYQEFINTENTKESFLGTGINSKIINRLAKAIGGEIVIKNNAHSGSEYILIMDFEFQQQPTSNGIKKVIFDDSLQSTNYKVLIVDDNKLNLLVADKILSKEQFDCTTIDNGFDAIDLAKENEYDIILMDINMPRLNGIGTTKRIRKFNTSTPIIALTAVDVTQLNRQIVRAGLNDYILKPYNKNHLLEMIHKYINSSSVKES
ncbi:response regulator [Aquimarina sp. I32.4]|uniref:response regulator n=1 Tax=Aquimarina sp. I32.4 TaxID=2053903 RepID=UPI000CDEE098|nr:response regulator [Aquimarina sp. I32.4]